MIYFLLDKKIFHWTKKFFTGQKNVYVGFGFDRIRNQLASRIRKKYLRMHNTENKAFPLPHNFLQFFFYISCKYNVWQLVTCTPHPCFF